jgi:RHS repeat-associated protein
VTRGIDPPEVEGYQWDGWKLIMIAKLNTDGTFHSRKWSCGWRPDVGSGLYARSDWMRAGGVGGVAWVQTGAVQSYSYGTGGAEVHVPLADHMGNVRHYYQFKATKGNVTGQLVASYEYDAFGREVRAWGLNTPTENQPPGLPASRPWADLLPFHYSSKLRDVDSGFNYYGYRFYDPGAGRWLNRDPIGERGGVNLYGMVGNDAVNGFDILGLSVGVISNGTDVPTSDEDQSHSSAGDLLAKLKTKSIRQCTCIKRLDIGGHGNPEGIRLGPMSDASGTYIDRQSNGADTDNWLSDSNVEWFATQLKELMCQRCTIYLSGCNTGNLKGADVWFKKLGRITGCRIVTNGGYGYGNISGDYRAVTAGPDPIPDTPTTRPSKTSTIYRYDPVKDRMYAEVIAPPGIGMP